jgi:hypothetical protein
MSDPTLDGLMLLDAEMERSVVGRPVQIRYHETTLNRELGALLAHYPDLPYKNLQVDLQRDQVTVSGHVMAMGFQLSTKVLGTVTVRDCLPETEVQAISIAGVFTPRFVRDRIEDMILESLSWYPTDYPLCLEQIVLENDRVTVYASRR